MISRRQFLALTQALGWSALFSAVSSSCSRGKEIEGSILGANATLGHRLRTMDFGPVTETLTTDIVIAGGGVAGLSAARYVKKHTNNFYLLELAEQVGGNALGGSNAISKFPWGAHYLPIPGNNDPELIAFLHEANAITGVRNGLPVYNEYFLCHDPKERLYIHNFWQEGIVPHEGVPQRDREEIRRFLALMHAYKIKTGNDGRPAFTIPVDFSSQDPEFLRFDAMTAEEFLISEGFRSPYLRWYINYCCADDFGSTVANTSAWAMIHYFASRNAKAFNAASDAVLTWPEGNYWLVNQLQLLVQQHILANTLVYEIRQMADGVVCAFFDTAKNITRQVKAKAVIVATPQYITHRILHDVPRAIDYTRFEYAPWMVANIVTDHPLDERRGEPLCWDNVIYGSDALGYVNAAHQNVNFPSAKKVITYYKPLLTGNASVARQQARNTSFTNWRNLILNDLKKPHPDLAKHTEAINIWIWGHGMIRPSKNFVWSADRMQAKDHAGNIFFAHSDLGGISIFEEAFYHGHCAAKMALSR